MKPKILIIGEEGLGKQYRNYVISLDYARAVSEAGGLPMLALDMYHPEDYLELADGLLLTGGPDLHCGRYGACFPADIPLPPIDVFRDEMDFTACRAFMRAGKPVFGIGRGMQVLNVALGGSLYQDIYRETGEYHPDVCAADVKNDGVTEKAQFSFHAVRTNDETKLSAVLSPTEQVNSCHHQAVKRLGEGLTAAATAPDGIIEAVEHERMPWFGVQWHPERTAGSLAADGRLFAHFITLCKEVVR